MKEQPTEIERRTVQNFQEVPRSKSSGKQLVHIVYSTENYTTVDIVNQSNGEIVQGFEVVHDQPLKPSTDEVVDHL